MGRQVAAARPKVSLHDGIAVVRDDLHPGGTKARFLRPLMRRNDCDEYVYASPAEGGAQTSVAVVAAELGKKATIFVAKRKKMHPRARMAKRLGARVIQVPHGYLNVVQAAARKYCERRKGRHLLPFGMDTPAAVAEIAKAAAKTGLAPDEVWCAAGSGTLIRGLAMAWPRAKLCVVQVGRELKPIDVAGATVYVHPRKFEQVAKTEPPFPSDPHYDAKAWEVCVQKKGIGNILFWNVVGPAE